MNVKHINVKNIDQGLSRSGVHRQNINSDDEYDEDDDVFIESNEDYDKGVKTTKKNNLDEK
jgi:hypothetical protein